MHMRLIFALSFVFLSGCTLRSSILEVSGMTESEKQEINHVLGKQQKAEQAQNKVIQGILVSLGEVRDKLGMNKEKK